MRFRKQWSLGALVALSVVTAACGSGSKEQGHEGHSAAPANGITLEKADDAGGTTKRLPNGDLQETTASIQVVPGFLKGKPQSMVNTYKLAAANADLLQYIPCYCGCGASAGHTSNKNCFVKEVGSDGKIVWDDHGTRCDVCLMIAQKSVKMKEDGMSTKEIRAAIDQAYNKGYAPPTKTILPPA